MIGQGGMGTVHRGRDLAEGRDVALKILDPMVLGSRVERRFLREGQALGRFRHPNILQVFEVGRDPEGAVWMAMELMDRGNAQELLKKRGALPISWCLQIADLLLAGLQEVHAAGYVHRDVKPANILLDSRGAVKLGDFGILREVDSDLTLPGSALGTLAFMSPEQTDDATRVTPRSDLYSLGATLYALATGRPPRQLAWLDADQAESESFEQVPAPLRALVRRACAFQPDRRFADATDMREAVRALRVDADED